MCRTKERAGDSLSVPCATAPGHAVNDGGALTEERRGGRHPGAAASVQLCGCAHCQLLCQSHRALNSCAKLYARPAARAQSTGDAPERVCARMATVLMVELVMFIRMGIGGPFNAQ